MRSILGGERSNFDGGFVQTHGFRLRRTICDPHISVAAFGPAMLRVAALQADEVVLNLVPVEHVRAVRARIDEEAAAAGRTAPGLAVWVPVSLDPGDEARAQIRAQLALYLAPPGYGEMFSAMGFSEFVERARSGVPPFEIADSIPVELLQLIGALGSLDEVAGRVSAYVAAGADVVAIAPSTAEDPGGHAVLRAISQRFPQGLVPAGPEETHAS